MKTIQERAIESYDKNVNPHYHSGYYRWCEGYEHGAKEQREIDLLQCAKWINEHMLDYCGDCIGCNSVKMANDFYETMKKYLAD